MCEEKYFEMVWSFREKKIAKNVYVSEIECPRRRGKPVVRWKNRVKVYMHERWLIEGD